MVKKAGGLSAGNVENSVAAALRMAAQYQGIQSMLGKFYRRMRAKLGDPKATPLRDLRNL